MTVMGEQTEKACINVLIMAGGTGGHVFPALAVARLLRQQGAEVQWLGTRRGIEAQLVPQENIAITYIGVSGLRGKGIVRRLLAPLQIASAVIQSVAAIIRLRPDCVLGMGGFASGPGGVAAWLLRKPLLIHEQNAVAGLTNRLLSRLAMRVMAAFPSAFGELVSGRVRCIGNPVRAEIVALEPPESRYADRQGPLRILVLGGSLGASVLNEALPEILALFPEGQQPEVWHQTGKGVCDATRASYQKVNAEVRVEEFIKEMHEAYRWADMIICRAGALTVSEISCAGLPAIFIPYPYAVDDHQTENAKFLERAGAAAILQQDKLTAPNLYKLLSEKFNTRDKLLSMAEKARALAQFDATEQVVNYCREACHARA